MQNVLHEAVIEPKLCAALSFQNWREWSYTQPLFLAIQYEATSFDCQLKLGCSIKKADFAYFILHVHQSSQRLLVDSKRVPTTSPFVLVSCQSCPSGRSREMKSVISLVPLSLAVVHLIFKPQWSSKLWSPLICVSRVIPSIVLSSPRCALLIQN